MTMMKFVEMLTFMRPAGSVYEEAFIDKYIRPLGPKQDAFGNLILDVGKPEIIWSSHTDTVHDRSGLQQLFVDRNRIVRVRFPSSYKDKKNTPDKSNCLGADCTTGVYIMIEMIKAGVAGRYIFHRDEESGRKGSQYIAKNTPDVLKGFNVAIAFDRKGMTDVITHQQTRSCSDKFAESLAAALGMGYKPNSNGMYTDTRSYIAHVAECTNISVGYQGAHTASESQDLVFLERLVERMRNFDPSGLVIERTPAEPPVYQAPNRQYSAGYYTTPTTMMHLVQQAPTSTAKLLELLGFTFETLDETIAKIQKVKDNEYDIWHDAEDSDGNKLPDALIRPKKKGNQLPAKIVH